MLRNQLKSSYKFKKRQILITQRLKANRRIEKVGKTLLQTEFHLLIRQWYSFGNLTRVFRYRKDQDYLAVLLGCLCWVEIKSFSMNSNEQTNISSGITKHSRFGKVAKIGGLAPLSRWSLQMEANIVSLYIKQIHM